MAYLILSLFFFSSIVSSIPFAEPGPNLAKLLKRDTPCDPGNVPILYTKEYTTADCPPKYTMKPDGTCPVSVDDGCTSYCEVRQNFYYGEEVPLDNGFCHGPLTCSIADSKTKSYTWNGGGNVGGSIAKILNIGVTGGYSQATTNTQTKTTSIPLKQGQCGYFTYLPILHDSCGTLTEAPLNSGFGQHFYCDNPSTNTGNFCSTQPYRSTDGSQVVGDTIFVYTDCSNHQRLPVDQQDPAYNHPNVPQPQSDFVTFSQNWDCTLSDQCQNPEGNAINPACTCTCAGQQTSLQTPGCAGFQGSLPDPPATTNPTQAPYAEGTCSFHMTYWRPEFWQDGTNPYEIEIRILDNNKATIGWLPHTHDNNNYIWKVVSRLEDPLEVTPESQNDYVQFSLPNQSWRTDQDTDASKIPNCGIGDWDCSDDPCVSAQPALRILGTCANPVV